MARLLGRSGRGLLPATQKANIMLAYATAPGVLKGAPACSWPSTAPKRCS